MHNLNTFYIGGEWVTPADGFSLADIALQTGFSNQAHFTQTFREHTSLTPREFRRK